jgi:hypothetical protein
VDPQKQAELDSILTALVADGNLLSDRDMEFCRDSEMRAALEMLALELEAVWKDLGQINPNHFVTHARSILAKYPKVNL